MIQQAQLKVVYTNISLRAEWLKNSTISFYRKAGRQKVVQTSYGYHYIEILGQKGSETGYNIAHLAKPIVASQETVDAANTAATQFAASKQR